MSWRSSKTTTGTNDVPLGKMRKFGPTTADEPQNAEPERGRPTAPSGSNSSGEPPKRKSRFGAAKTDVPGLPTAVSATGVSVADLDKYAIQVRLEEINRKLRMNDYVPPDNERSPSPPPTYDAHGRRTNTRDVRYRKRLEEERVKLIDKAMKSDPTFRPPAEYHQQKRSHRPQDKVYIPVKEFPEINFFGLLVGPRGNSLKKMERESGAKISIRGKGSVKEGKGRPDAFADDSEEDLHCLVTADTDEKVATCVALINKVIETAASTPEGENVHKRNQLRELAALNGTLRDDENQICQNCGNVGHRKYDCPEVRNYTANIICRVCGSAGHMARDCTQRRGDPNGFGGGGFGGPPPQFGGPPPTKFDSEYDSLMAELGEKPGSGGGNANPGSHGGNANAPGSDTPNASSGGYIPPGFTTVPPWRRPEIWQPPSAGPPGGQGGYRPPQQGYGANGGYGGYQGQQQGNYGGGQQQQQQQWGGYGNYQQGGGGYDANAYAQYYQGYYQQQQGGQGQTTPHRA